MMRMISGSNRWILYGYLSFAAVLVGCVGASQPPASTEKVVPAEWTQEFGLVDLLEEPTTIGSQEDIGRLLGKTWYAGIDVETGKKHELKTLKSCNDYFSIVAAELHVRREQEINAFLELKVMCEAARLLSLAAPAFSSGIPKEFLNEQLPSTLPYSIALITSQGERDRLQSKSSPGCWSDINAVRRVDQNTAHKSTYYSDAGVQVLAELGRGDVNGDTWADVLVLVKDTVDGGSYFNVRLFVLTVDAHGRWQVVAQY